MHAHSLCGHLLCDIYGRDCRKWFGHLCDRLQNEEGYRWNFGDFMCKLNSFVSVISMFTSIFLLMAISVDRCLSVCVVVWAQNKRTVVKAQLTVTVIWVAAALCSIPYTYFREVIVVDFTEVEKKTYCTYKEGTPLLMLETFRLVVGFVIPFLVICVSYMAIFVRARRLQRTRTHRSYKVILSIIFAFFFCWLPFHIVRFIEQNVGYSKYITYIGGPVVAILAFTNSCLNPFLYVFMCHEFQRKLKQSVCFVLESALAEDFLVSSRSLSSHLSISRSSQSAASVQERRGTDTSLKLIDNKQPPGAKTPSTG
ncbi:chemokine-like receptor 1 [Solea senegalensis]|uniref:Chemokine-like receptor 1 n=1 Tax=Solea senegalensis TaxID=28829 RepID=A0AAV6PSZ4_SOLSE|nr:chemokine-like receptor 1 [Solea senegalensis]